MITLQGFNNHHSRFCKKCFAVLNNQSYLICSCFLPGKNLGCLKIYPNLYNSLIMDVYQVVLYDTYKDEYNFIQNDLFSSVFKILFAVFLSGKSVAANNIVLKYSPARSNTNFLFQTIDSIGLKNLLNRNESIILSMYRCYFSLLCDYEFSNELNERLLKKIHYLEDKNDLPIKSCRSCLKSEEKYKKLQVEYNNITENFSNARKEKEKIVMKYVNTEKLVLEAQKGVDFANKQRDDAVKEKVSLQNKLKKASDDITKLLNENKQKQTEITKLKNSIAKLEEDIYINKIKFKGQQNRLKTISDNQEETQRKLVESSERITELQNECESFRLNIHNVQKVLTGVGETTNFVSDKNLEQQSVQVFSEQNLSHKLQISEERRSISEKENKLLLSQIQLLQSECTDLKAKLIAINTLYEKEKAEGQTVKNQLNQVENANKLLELKADHLTKIEVEFQHLQKINSELLSDIDSYRQREIQMLGFTEQVTDKHVQLQSKFTDMKTKLLILENNQNPLLKNINILSNKIQILEHNLYSEKLKHNQECEALTKCLAEQIYYSQKLAQQLEETEGENFILQKRKKLIIREMTKES